MTETPSSGFPEPGAPGAPSPTPPAFPPPPAGDPAAPAAAWGQPAPYGQPYAPPPKKKRIWLRVLLGVVGVFVVLIIAGVIAVLVRTKHHLTAKATAAGLSQVEPSGSAKIFIDGFKSAPQYSKAKHVVTTAYDDGGKVLGVAGADTGDLYTDPTKGLDNIAGGLKAAGGTGFIGIDTGDSNVKISCGDIATTTLCVWVDHDTFAITVEDGTDRATLGEKTKQIRIDLEKK